MKRFDDLTDPELLALIDEQVQYHIDRECAEEGVPLLPPSPGAEPTRPVAPKDVTVFVVGGMLFADREHAEKVAALANQGARLVTEYADYRSGFYDHIAAPATADVDVATQQHYSRGTYDRVREALSAYASAKKKWDAGQKERTDATTGRARIAEHVHEKIDAAREVVYLREQAKAEFARYVQLADGDEVMARRFFEKAKPHSVKYLDPATTSADVPAVPVTTPTSVDDQPF